MLLAIFLLNVIGFENIGYAFDIEHSSPNQMTPEKSHQIHEQQQIFKILLVAIPVSVLLVVVATLVRLRKNKTKSKAKRKRMQ